MGTRNGLSPRQHTLRSWPLHAPLLLALALVVGLAAVGCAPRDVDGNADGNDPQGNEANANEVPAQDESDGDNDEKPTEPPDPYRVESVALSGERGFAWRMPGIGVQLEVHLAPAPNSRLDLLRDESEVREAATQATREAVTERLVETWESILGWVAEQVPAAKVAPSLPEHDAAFTLILHEHAHEQTPLPEGAWLLEFERFAEPGILEEMLWRETLPGVPAALAFGLSRLSPQQSTGEAAWLTREYAWIWASQFGIHHDDLVEVAPLMRGVTAHTELNALERWQLVDFVAYLLGQAGFELLGTFDERAEEVDWEKWQRRWREDRLEWGDDPREEPHLEALWRLEHNEVDEAFARIPRPLPAQTLRTERRAVVHEGLGRLAFLVGDARFCRLWLTEVLLRDAHNRVLMRPDGPLPPAQLVPVVDVPLEAVAGAAFDEGAAAERAAAVLLEAGRPELALLMHAILDLVDGSPQDAQALARLERWAEAPYGDAALAEFAHAWAESEAGETSAADERAAALPEPYASAWRAR